MKNIFVKILSGGLAASLALMTTGCSLTTTTSSDIVEETVSYIDTDGDGVKDTPADNVSGGTDANSSNTSGISSGNTSVNTGSENNAGEVDSSKEKKLTGTFELQIFTGGYGSEAWEYAIEKFQEYNPDLKINAHLDANVNTQMKTRWAKDNPPDFVFLDGTDLPAETWMKEGKMLDLSDIYNNGKVYGTDTPIKTQLKSGLTASFGNTNKIYQMPVLLSTYGLWYDSALFSQKGWKMPTNYTELQNFCKQAKSEGMNPFIYPGKYSGYLVWGLVMPAVASAAIASNDIQFFYDIANATDSKLFNDKRFKGQLEKLESLANAGYFDINSLSMDHITSQSAWLKHNAAIIPNGLWLESEMKDTTPEGFEMRYYPSALHDAGQQTCIIASASSVGIAAKAKNPEAAKAFLRFLYTDDVAVKFAEYCGVPSAARTDMKNAKLTNTAKQVNEMINSSSVRILAKGFTTWGTVDSVVNDCVNQIVNKKMTADEACKKIAEATDKKNNK